MKLMKPVLSDFPVSINRSIENSLNFENSSIYEPYVSKDPSKGNTSILNLYTIDNVILDDMIKYLKQISPIKLYDKNQEFIYRYRPMLLSTHIYGYMDFWYIILAVNDYISIYEFKNFTRLIIPEQQVIENLFNKEVFKRKNIGISNLN